MGSWFWRLGNMRASCFLNSWSKEKGQSGAQRRGKGEGHVPGLTLTAASPVLQEQEHTPWTQGSPSFTTSSPLQAATSLSTVTLGTNFNMREGGRAHWSHTSDHAGNGAVMIPLPTPRCPRRWPKAGVKKRTFPTLKSVPRTTST